MRKSILATAVAGALGMVGVASAGPLGPLPFGGGLSLSVFASGPNQGDFTSVHAQTCGTFSCIAGEGTLVNSLIGTTNPLFPAVTGQKQFVPDTAVQHVDWIVVHDGNSNGGYTYYYQITNSSISGLGSMTISNPNPAFNFAAGTGGFDTTVDLDNDNALTTLGHNTTNFLNLLVERNSLTTPPFNGPGKGEFEFSDQAVLNGPTAANVVSGTLVATFDVTLLPLSESGVFFAQGTLPDYGVATTEGRAFIWSTEDVNPCTGPNGTGTPNADPSKIVFGPRESCEQGIRVPVPGVGTLVPEPASLLLLSGGLLALGAYTRRRRQS